VPKLIVYVKADTWRRIETGYGPDAPALMRNISVEAIEDFLKSSEGATVTGERRTASENRDGTAAPPGDTAGPTLNTQRSQGSPTSSPDDDALPSPSARSGRCGMNTPAGTKCKVCGKVHPL
jgi:hypothetical protein